jgi:hypothetical protein
VKMSCMYESGLSIWAVRVCCMCCNNGLNGAIVG